MFRRKIYNELLEWKKTYNGTRAALIEGPRRVGKTTIVQEFARNEYKSCIFIDFANVKKDALEIFVDIADLDLFFARLQIEFNVKLYKRDSVIVFDEVQLFPIARQAIKHLVKDGRYDYIETGSLISIRKNVKNILIPSEEHKIPMYPMSWEEFCIASDMNYGHIEELCQLRHPIGEAVNRKLIRDFRTYMAVGGMPQAVEAYIDKKSFSDIDEIKREIIELYKDDLRKIDPSGRMSMIYASVPSQLVAKRNRFSFRNATKSSKTSKDDERIIDLIDSRTVGICYNVFEPSFALEQFVDMTHFKLYLMDTGLFVTMLFNNGGKNHEDIYKKLLSDKLDLNFGYLYENAAAQLIMASKRRLYYHTWPKNNSAHKYEVDFLIANDNKVTPIEIKSARISSHDSLDAFLEKYSRASKDGLIVSPKDYSNNRGVHNLPFYLFEEYLKSL